MERMPRLPRLSTACVLAGALWASWPTLGTADPGTPSPRVAVLYDPSSLPVGPIRDGAAEFALLVRVAQLRQHDALAGLVCVDNRYTALLFKSQNALVRVVLMGVPVVKIPWNRQLTANPDQVFIEAGTVSPAASEQLLADCLARYGAPPAASNPDHPTRQELRAISAKIRLYQGIFDAAARSAQVAMR
jgi:hypothetical protein